MDLKIVLKTKGNNYSADRTPVRMESESENLLCNANAVIVVLYNNSNQSAITSLTRKAVAKYICI